MSGHTCTHTYIYTHDNYYIPRCAHAHRGLMSQANCAVITIVMILVSSNVCCHYTCKYFLIPFCIIYFVSDLNYITALCIDLHIMAEFN